MSNDDNYWWNIENKPVDKCYNAAMNTGYTKQEADSCMGEGHCVNCPIIHFNNNATNNLYELAYH